VRIVRVLRKDRQSPLSFAISALAWELNVRDSPISVKQNGRSHEGLASFSAASRPLIALSTHALA
jgi:hypothetical protein